MHKRRRTFFIIYRCMLSSAFVLQGCGKMSSSLKNAFEKPLVYAVKEPDNHVTKMYSALAGAKVQSTDQNFVEAYQKIRSGEIESAAEVITQDANFYQVTVRNFAAQMSTKAESENVELNDFIATVIGITRDDIPATEMLTGNFFYWAPDASNIRKDLKNDVVGSNNHYLDLESHFINLKESLVRNDVQYGLNEQDQLNPLPDTAGVITSRSFMQAHGFEGTNRRLVEFSLRAFLCMPLESIASTTNSDAYVGRDVTRGSDYQTKCVSCHSVMDAMRPAFAHVDFIKKNNLSFIAYGYKYSKDQDANDATKMIDVPQKEQMVPSKFRRAANNFPEGYKVTDDEWINLDMDNPSKVGWTGAGSGSGMHALGEMLSKTGAFKKCMAERAFKAVCKKSPSSQVKILLAKYFEFTNFNLKKLFIKSASVPSCLGDVE